MSDEVVLYDLATCDGGGAFSVNTWKSKLYLNYKGIPYRTVWIEYADVASTLSGLGIPARPRTDGGIYTAYTVPTIRLPSSGAFVTDSAAIAPALESLHPDPAVPIDNGYLTRFDALITRRLFMNLAVDVLPATCRKMLGDNNRNRDAYESQVAAKLGVGSIDDFARQGGAGTDAPWDRSADAYAEWEGMLAENPEGPFFLGEQVCYADIYAVAVGHGLRRLDERFWERLCGFGERIRKQYEALEKWTEKCT